MRRNIVETVMGAVVLLVAIIFVAFAFQSARLQSAAGYEVVAEFDNAAGLAPGTEVRLSGVKVGTVVGQSLDPTTYFAIITLNLSEEIRLPTDTSARVIPDGLLGGNYIALEPGGAEEMIEPGGRISYTQGAVNVVDLLGRFIFSAAESAGDSGK